MTPDDYQQAVRALARTAEMPDEAAARVEAALGQAFESSAAGSEHSTLHARPFGALAAAAALLIVVGGGAWYRWRPLVTSNNVTSASPTATGKADVKVGHTGKANLKVGPTAIKVGPTETADLKVDSRARGAHLQVGRNAARKLPPVIRPQGFVAVPAAARLPQFESGVIVRMSLPVASLPAYGVDISPVFSDQPIEADVLVGQDGRARAIRLVNTSRSQQ